MRCDEHGGKIMEDKDENEDEFDQEIYDYYNSDAFYKEWYGVDTDEELYDAEESNDYDYD